MASLAEAQTQPLRVCHDSAILPRLPGWQVWPKHRLNHTLAPLSLLQLMANDANHTTRNNITEDSQRRRQNKSQ